MLEERPPLYERLKKALEDGIAFERGEKSLRTTQLALSIAPPHLTPEQITDLRGRLQLSQVGFARLLAVTSRTVKSWERGQKAPSGSATRLMQLLGQSQPLDEFIQPFRKLA